MSNIKNCQISLLIISSVIILKMAGFQVYNIVTTISVYYAQFLLLQNLNNKSPTNSEIYHQDFKALNKNNLERDLVNTDWDAILEINNGDVGKSFKSFITTVNSIIAEHVPLKKYQLKNEN